MTDLDLHALTYCERLELAECERRAKEGLAMAVWCRIRAKELRRRIAEEWSREAEKE